MRYALVGVYAAVPLAALGADNGRLVGVSDLAPYYLGIVLMALAVTAFVAWRRGHAAADAAAIAISVSILAFFDYWDFRPHLSALTHDSRPSMVFLWAVVIGVVGFIAVRLTRRVARPTLVLLLAGCAMLVPSLVSWARESSARPARIAQVPARSGERLDTRHAPNVYFFMLDAYSRSDFLRGYFRFDNSKFVNSLRSDGFVVPPATQTAYGFTVFSVPSMLQMRYVITHGMLDVASVEPAMAGHNAVADTFRGLGYSVAWAPSELPGWKCDGSEDACIHPTQTYQSHLGVSQLQWAIMERTPVADAMRSVAPVHLNPLTARRQFPLRVAKSEAGHRLRPPVFTFAHVLLTHWPYLYLGPKCKLATTRGRLGAKAYVQAVQCANANTLAATRFILKRDPHAVIVIASDHGTDVDIPGTRPMWEWERHYITRRFSNFTALRLPPQCRGDVPKRLLTVNIFRVVLNCLADPDMPMEKPRRYLSSPQNEVRRDWGSGPEAAGGS